MALIVVSLMYIGIIGGLALTFWIKKDADKRALPGMLYAILYVISFACAWMGLPAFFLLWYYLTKSKVYPVAPDAKEEFSKLGVNADKALSILNKGSGLVLDEQNRILALGLLKVRNGKAEYVYRKYSFDDVRNWRYNIQTGGEIHAVGSMSAAMQASLANDKIRKENQANTGLFIHVKDTEFPEWQFHLSHDNIKRWYEILTQAFEKDGSVVPA